MKKNSIVIVDDPYIEPTEEQRKNVIVWFDKLLDSAKSMELSFYVSREIRGKERKVKWK